MIINSKIKNTSDAIDYLNRAVFGEDPETSVLTRVYEGVTPIQDRITAVENSAALVDVQALKDKVDELNELTEIFANFAAPMPNLVANGDFTDGVGTWVGYFNATLSIENNALKVIKSAGPNISTFRQPTQLNITTEDLFYFSLDLKASYSFTYFQLTAYQGGTNTVIQSPNYNVTPTNFTTFSHIGNFSSNMTTTTFGISVYINSEINTSYLIKNIKVYNVSQMKLKGIKNDDGVPFTLLTDGQIKTQLDLWVQTRFPLDVLLMMRS